MGDLFFRLQQNGRDKTDRDILPLWTVRRYVQAHLHKFEPDADTLKWYEEQWLSAQEVANEAEEQMLSDYEAWLEAIKAETQNAIDIQNKEWEKSLIAGMFGEGNKFSSFEDVNLALDRQKSLQEDILTTTNKKYETDKLIR